jgi:hypothetical protein
LALATAQECHPAIGSLCRSRSNNSSQNLEPSALLAIRDVRREFVLGDDSLQIQFTNSLEQRDAGAVNVIHVSYERLIMNCAIYARVSTRDKGQDLTNQLIALLEFTAKQGWAIFNEYVDQHSAKDDDLATADRLRWNVAILH